MSPSPSLEAVGSLRASMPESSIVGAKFGSSPILTSSINGRAWIGAAFCPSLCVQHPKSDRSGWEVLAEASAFLAGLLLDTMKQLLGFHKVSGGPLIDATEVHKENERLHLVGCKPVGRRSCARCLPCLWDGECTCSAGLENGRIWCEARCYEGVWSHIFKPLHSDRFKACFRIGHSESSLLHFEVGAMKTLRSGKQFPRAL